MELRRVAPVAGLVALLLVDGALIAWAVRPLPAEVAESVSTAAPAASPSATPAAPDTSSSPTPSASSRAKVLSARPLTLVAGAADGNVWVAESGTCERPGTVWVSTDGGDSWTSSQAPAQVLRVRPDTGVKAFVTGGDADCALRLWNTYDGAASWGGAESAEAAWSRDPEDASSVHLPNGTTAAACGEGGEVVDLAPSDASVAVALCDDRAVRSTNDGGDSWSEGVEVKGALSLALASDTSAALVPRSTSGCKGVVPAVVRGTEVTDGDCVRSRPRAGKVAAATDGARWWIVVGEEVFVADEPEGPWKATEASLGS